MSGNNQTLFGISISPQEPRLLLDCICAINLYGGEIRMELAETSEEHIEYVIEWFRKNCKIIKCHRENDVLVIG